MSFRLPRALHSKYIATVALLGAAFWGVYLQAEIRLQRIAPPDTSPAIEAVHGPHIALYDFAVPSNHKLFVFLPGTHGAAEKSLAIDTAFVKMGYDVIALDYENDLAAASCFHSKDADCLDLYHKAILQGLPGSDKVTVTPANSVLNRLQKLLVYLSKQDPDGGWSEFLIKDQPAWSKVVIAGHSQGSGHAAYIAKLYRVDKAIMLSGPQEYFVDLDMPAAWQSRPGATPPSRYFAFLGRNDPADFHHQLANCTILMKLAAPPDPPIVEAGKSIVGDYQVLSDDVEAKRAHNSTASPQFENAWIYFGNKP